MMAKSLNTEEIADDHQNNNQDALSKLTKLTELGQSADTDCYTKRAVEVIRNGAYFFKVRPPGKFFARRYFVDSSDMNINYFPSQKKYFCRNIPNVDLCEVTEIRTGWSTNGFNAVKLSFKSIQKYPEFVEDNCFSIVAKSRGITLDLVAPNKELRDIWVDGLRHMVAILRQTQKENEFDVWLKDQFQKADYNANGSLNFYETQSLLRQLNISMDKKEAKNLFEKANFRKTRRNSEEALDPDEFVKFFRSLSSRPELDALFTTYTVDQADIMGPQELKKFLITQQKMDVTAEDCINIIKKFEPEPYSMEGFFSIKGFTAMLTSYDHDIFNKNHRNVHQDMTKPLNQYFIASSHNTYLLANQLYGESSIEGYINALMRASRCVELDVWNGSNLEPIIKHGHTLTTEILFKDVLETIKSYAFRVSKFPVILSIENHCDIEQQRKIARYMDTVLGDLLDNREISEDETAWPSPEALSGKILIKYKKLPNEPVKRNVSQSVIESEDSSEEEEIQAEMDTSPLDDDVEKKIGIAKELSQMVNYCKSKKFKNFEDSFNWKFYEMSSFSESMAESLIETQLNEFTEFNKKYVSRIYPRGTRTNSSNYNPVTFWNVGCQMVALNYQTWGTEMFLNEAQFNQNGRCGYVLKPDFLRPGEVVKPSTVQKKLELTILSGQHIPKPGQNVEGEVVDPYVTVHIYGDPKDFTKIKTKIVQNNGFNPIWNEKFEFLITVPQLAFLHFVVKDQNYTGINEPLGHYAIALNSITEGYRHIHLFDCEGHKLSPATLFVHISITEKNRT